MLFTQGQRVKVIRGTDLTFEPRLLGALGTVRVAQAHSNGSRSRDAGEFYLVLLDRPIDGCRQAGFWGDELEPVEPAMIDCSGLLEE